MRLNVSEGLSPQLANFSKIRLHISVALCSSVEGFRDGSGALLSSAHFPKGFAPDRRFFAKNGGQAAIL
jgi:hypothetical protein